jgi:hypothetical protein
MQLSADAGLTIAGYTAEPGSRSEDGLNLLDSWAATIAETNTADTSAPATAALGGSRGRNGDTNTD